MRKEFGINMKVCFVLPKFSRKPIGGFKIVFEYANRMSQRGHQVEILFLNECAFETWNIPTVIKKKASDFLTVIEPKWFELNSSIKKISGTEPGMIKKIEGADIAIATAVDTVPAVEKLFRNTRKAYFIQDYEAWNVSEDEVKSTYRLGFNNIVISDWLKEIVDGCTTIPSILIKNPVDIDVYCCKVAPKMRKKHSISFLYHEGKHKGAIYAIAAIEKLKYKYPDLEVNSFGTAKAPANMPRYINYTYCASQKQTVEIYNRSAVFLCATVAEGYGLTGLEAMACGAALVSTDYQGVHEYATDGVNALLSPVKDVNALVSNVSKLFDNDELRYQIAEAGMKSVQKDFNWDVAVDRFEKAITE